MSELIKGKVLAVLVNRDQTGISTEQQKIQVFANEGVNGDSHFGPLRLADVRERKLKSMGIPKGIAIANLRQFSAVSKPELDKIAEGMGLPEIDFGLLGENLVFDIPITDLVTGSTIYFSSPRGERRTSVLMVMAENMPCEIPAGNIATRYPNLTIEKPFQTVAIRQRGVVGIVLSSGFIQTGDSVEIHAK